MSCKYIVHTDAWKSRIRVRENHASRLMGLAFNALAVKRDTSSLTVRRLDTWALCQAVTLAGQVPPHGGHAGLAARSVLAAL